MSLPWPRWTTEEWKKRLAGDVAEKFDPSEPRDKEGKWTAIEGGYGPARAEWEKRNKASIDADDAFFAAKNAHRANIERLSKQHGGDLNPVFQEPDYLETKKALRAAEEKMVAAEQALKRQEPVMQKEVVKNIASEVAEKLGVDPDVIHVVYKDPSSFEVGNKQFTEAGHFDPHTKQIELNAKNVLYGDVPNVKGITAHEVSHLIYDAAKTQSKREFEQYLKKALTPSGQDYTSWYHERFEPVAPGRMDVRLKPQYVEEMRKEFPASAALSGLSNGELFRGISEEMVKENGHSAYAKSYWSQDALSAQNAAGRERYGAAITETMAEVTRYLTYPKSWNEETTPSENSPWVKLTKAVHEWYADREDSRQYHPPDAHGRKYGEIGYNT